MTQGSKRGGGPGPEVDKHRGSRGKGRPETRGHSPRKGCRCEGLRNSYLESGLSFSSFFAKGQRFLSVLIRVDLADMELLPHADWAAEGEKETESGSSLVAFLLLWARVSSGLTWNSALLGLCRMKSKPQLAPEALHHLLYCPPWPDFP